MRLARLLLLPLAVSAGCAPARDRGDGGRRVTELPLAVLADTSAMLEMPAAPWPVSESAPARAALVRVSPSRAALDPPLPDAPALPPDAGTPEPPGPGFVVDDDLKPPIPRGALRLVLHARSRGWVELDVRVDETGAVTDAEVHASEGAEAGQMQSAIEAALAMRFHPALRRGEPVPVWTRQRFELGRLER